MILIALHPILACAAIWSALAVLTTGIVAALQEVSDV